ncbi:DUF6226 family protein [Agromyces cerinus]|uniref:Uncharacterized protein n=1 Tax=Agromyces cerinus subsp. cerinus TaxID=232089 RepID=A0A1N6EW57_9MICO|nr:DUF6226 family protein [Agromyces cerinus]SIN87197.1 hypothetical protein SAMN05443544_1514 [Agromyces cerinus subsp. cerinus]
MGRRPRGGLCGPRHRDHDGARGSGGWLIDGDPGSGRAFEPPRRGAASRVDELPVEPGRWGADGPPQEAYSRVGDTERYRPLHAFALALADDLEAEFDVERDDEPALDGWLTEGVQVVTGIRLRPRRSDAAPITIGLTSFPGVVVGVGEFTRLTLPVCGCDACDEHVADLVRSAREHVDAVVSGGFAEASGGWESFRTERGSSEGGGSGPFGPRRAWAAWPHRPAG